MELLEATDVTVRFGGVTAVDGAWVRASAGNVTGLIGPNGAGKTTLFDVITGMQRAATGRVRFDGRDVTRLSVHRRAQRGIARTFQQLETFPSLSVHDNVRAAAEIRRRWDRRAEDPAAVTRDVLDRVGLGRWAGERADRVPTGIARLVELARALAIRPRLLLLDEPSSGLGDEETERLGALLGELARDGCGVLMVEHDMELVMGVCQVVHVLEFGRVIASGSPAEVQADPVVREAYLGHSAVAAGGA